MMTEMKLPACYAVIDENEMTYLDGGATIADSDAYKAFLNVGQVFNQLARIFSGAICWAVSSRSKHSAAKRASCFPRRVLFLRDLRNFVCDFQKIFFESPLQRHFCYGFVAFRLVECCMYGCSEFRRISVRKSLFRAAGPVPALQRF